MQDRRPIAFFNEKLSGTAQPIEGLNCILKEIDLSKSLKKINDNAYKVDLLGEYNVSTTFNVSDLSPYDAVNDSRLNPF
jgi:hypothetical protein